MNSDKSGQTVIAMLNTGTNVNVSDNKNKSTPLHLAVNQGNDAGVKALLSSRHCDVNCQVSRLHYAGFLLKCIYINDKSALSGVRPVRLKSTWGPTVMAELGELKLGIESNVVVDFSF